ncbi:hypothetical protein ACHAXR_012260 [Thalassiosira sp. AJA248-18]
MAIADGKNVVAAFGLVCVAGAASTIGASVVFFPSLIKRASPRVLAAALGLSAGTMIYVSFAEIFTKSIEDFVNSGMEEDLAYVYATLSFFGGVLVMKVIDLLIKRLTRNRPPVRREQEEDIEINWNEDVGEANASQHQEEIDVPEIASTHYCVGCSHDPVGELQGWHELAELELQAMHQEEPPPISTISLGRRETSVTIDEESVGHSREEAGPAPVVLYVHSVPTPEEPDGFFRAPSTRRVNPKEEKRILVQTGAMTAMAIILHNFPEGLATFIAALDDPSVGAVLAIGIGIHNIPEGLVVALPIYYATGNRWRAFRWGCVAGISEPIAAVLGWLVLANAMSEAVYATLYGLVSGMMVMISLKELIPPAHRYDPEDTVVTTSIIVGMVIMALSLVLLQFTYHNLI